MIHYICSPSLMNNPLFFSWDMICGFGKKYQAFCLSKRKASPGYKIQKDAFLQDAQADFDGASLFFDTQVRSIISGGSSASYDTGS